MLGSVSDADDAVQEAWLRPSRADTSDVEDMRTWLTTVVARVSLNVLAPIETGETARRAHARADREQRRRPPA
jgi:DNA-directed RNA polymerase specialized sigma24 family protein